MSFSATVEVVDMHDLAKTASAPHGEAFTIAAATESAVQVLGTLER